MCIRDRTYTEPLTIRRAMTLQAHADGTEFTAPITVNHICLLYTSVAVISSALCGMVSGSSVGNTVTTGSFTIPMMKKTGYKPEFAGAVEAAASTGGQIMPPIMGAAAFLMIIAGINRIDIFIKLSKLFRCH